MVWSTFAKIDCFPASFFIMKFSMATCKLLSPYKNVFDIHARLAIYFNQVAINSNQFEAYGIGICASEKYNLRSVIYVSKY